MPRFISLFALFCLIAILPQAALAANSGRIVLPTDVTPLHYDIAITPAVASKSFTGNVKITLDVKAPTKTIALNAAELTFGKVALSGAATPALSYDSEHETETLTFPKPVSAGRHTLSIDYSGKINQHAAGLFALDYDAADGKKSALFTQFENSDARRFVPCWDEPNRKATFTLTATVPANEMAVSNTPIASTDKLPGGLKRVHFAQSPKMSSYLLFFGAGDFERLSRKVNGVDIGIVYKRGDSAKAQYALDAASKILPYYEDYFGVKYPLPKLDLIAGPGQSQFFGAMENWGAIFYFERAVLIDPKISTESDKRGVYLTIAHEMSHQWFGDLVTMDWWEDLWLNEGFASWMEYKATDNFHPEWHVWMQAQNAKEGAMRVDARRGTHPIIAPIHDVLQANEAFDTITYSKGQAVIRMLESAVGEDAFRAGVRNYIKKHVYGNTVTDDLWRELDKTSSTPVSQIAHDFTLQAGVPLIRVATTANGIHLTQDRVADDDSGKAPTSWHVPVTVKATGDAKAWRGIVTREMPQDVAIRGKTAVIVNAGQTSYFRTAYDAAAFKPIVSQFHALTPEDQLGLINDARAEGYVGIAPFSNFLQLAGQATPDFNPIVLDTLAGRLQGVDQLYRDLKGQPAFRAFSLSVLQPIFAKVGWMPVPGEDQNIALLRHDLIDALSQLGDPAVVAEAKRRFAGFVKDPSSLTGDLRRSVLTTVAFHADAAIWEQLHALAKSTNDSMQKNEYYLLIGLSEDKSIAERALALSLTDEAPVTARPTIVAAVSNWYPEMAFDFAVAHLDQFNAMLEPDSRNQYEVRLAVGSFQPQMVTKVHAYAEAHIPATARQTAVKTEAAIANYAQIRAKYLPEIDSWLAHHKA